ncbi:MAG: hypothetical protein JWN64_319 [Parcubacteria group bacterium]|nr:hypothetical protein [Parcubacteria group bacterium]
MSDITTSSHVLNRILADLASIKPEDYIPIDSMPPADCEITPVGPATTGIKQLITLAARYSKIAADVGVKIDEAERNSDGAPAVSLRDLYCESALLHQITFALFQAEMCKELPDGKEERGCYVAPDWTMGYVKAPPQGRVIIVGFREGEPGPQQPH